MKREFSMRSVHTLFKLDLRSRFGSAQKLSVRQRILQIFNYLLYIVVYGILVAGMYFLGQIFVMRSGLDVEYLVIVTTATMLLATIVATSTVIKNLYQSGDNEMLLRFPVSGQEILVSKSIYCFLHNLVVCLLIMLPMYITYGVVMQASATDYVAYVIIVLLSSFLPFFIANIIAVPVMKLINAVKNKFVLVLIFTIIIVCVVFIVYLVLLGNVLTYMKDNNQSVFSGAMVARYRQFANNAYPFKWYAEFVHFFSVMCNERAKDCASATVVNQAAAQMGLRFLYITAINLVLGTVAAIITSHEYYKTILYGIETQKASFKKKMKDKKRSVSHTLFRREFSLILRSFNYSFQYLAMACAAPVMVFFCNRLAATMGTESVGADIMPGLTLMVIIIFITITVSFASTCISREGDCFYHTKIIPVSFTKQVVIKFCLYAVVATISVALCCLLSGLYYTSEEGGKVLSAVDVGAIFGISELLVLSLTSLSIISDIKSPTFNVSGDGELVSANKNVALAMVVGIVVAIAYGLFAMIFNFLPLTIGSVSISTPGHMENIYLILAALSGALLIGSVSGLFINLNKRYLNIVP